MNPRAASRSPSKKKRSGSADGAEKNARRMSAPLSPLQQQVLMSPAGMSGAPALNRSRHIRFDLPPYVSSNENSPCPLNETLTPPPKEFRYSKYPKKSAMVF